MARAARPLEQASRAARSKTSASTSAPSPAARSALAVIANADAAQAQAAGDAVDRWLTPGPARRACAAGAPQPARPGRYEGRLPADAPLARAMIGARSPRRAPPIAISPSSPASRSTAIAACSRAPSSRRPAAPRRGSSAASRAPALVIDVRAPADGLAAAVTEVKLMLARLPQSTTDADLDRAFAEQARLDQDGRANPHRRLVDLWAGPPPVSRAKPALAAFRAFLGRALADPALDRRRGPPRVARRRSRCLRGAWFPLSWVSVHIALLCPFTAGTSIWQAPDGASTLTACIRGTFSLVHGREAVLADVQEPVIGNQFHESGAGPRGPSLYAASEPGTVRNLAPTWSSSAAPSPPSRRRSTPSSPASRSEELTNRSA